MKPVKQKIMHSENAKGDCLRACICSLLEISDEGVPNFVEDNNYPEKLWNWCQANKVMFYNSDAPPAGIEFYMAWGTSPRGLKHSVIHKSGKLVHDPHPDGGDVKDITTYVWLERENKKAD
jgi:hypothetical protein